MTKLSIITPCLNRAVTLKAAIESVCAQNYPDVEHIIIDGGSTDGTLDVLKQYPHVRWISEPDKGLYDAINKGIALAQGEIIGHLNSDDVYKPNIFAAVMAAFDQNPDADSVCGGVEMIDGQGVVEMVFNDAAMKALRLWDITLGVPLTNGRFFRRSLYDRVGGYAPQYRIAADREFLLRAWNAGIYTAIIPEVVYAYHQHAGSLTFNPQAQYKLQELPEYMAIARAFMLDPDIKPELSRACHAWHTWEAGYQAWQAWRIGAYRAAFRFIIQGLKWDKLAMFRFLSQVIRRYLQQGT